ncbi:MAG TPA: exo-beta-N-acetylmuramidase NamZ domain-containing protein, partial [Verrucomicrobiae bacterium]|nr:exo-beta-N-acetylmuramidase NamZ domain-containing protein [Verrucomicrobiae bacterium]
IALKEKPTAAPGTLFRYSDINFILLGEIVHRISGQPLNEFVEHEIYAPLGMKQTSFAYWHLNSHRKYKQPASIAPTTREGSGFLRGVVHDPTARRMGGVAGHAGLFITANDLARFARMMLNYGELDGKRLFKRETVELFISVQSPPNLPRRGLGWDIDSPYAGPRGKYFPVGSYGHTGWTGTSIWIDPFSKSFVIFLSNRNHPTESGSVIALRSLLGTLSAEAIPDYNFTFVPGALERRPERPAAITSREVLNGVDVLKREKFARLKGLRIGLITNHTGHDRERNPTIDLLHEAEGVQLKALFSPEHGIRGALDVNEIKDSIDEKTGVPVYSLYDGPRRSPKTEQLQELDALVYDIQDIGCRFYTYTATMGNCLEAAAKAGIKMIVLDRIDPINGNSIEGPVAEKFSFTAYHNIPVRYGMTIGELARMFNAERDFKADLTVVQIQGWLRDFYMDQTEQPWTNPSPNMRSLTEAILYPGIGLLETTALSVGRGTDTPFEVVGAPYIDDLKLARELNAANLPGVRFVPIQFTPNTSVFKDKRCKGVNIILTDRSTPVVDVGITIALALQRLHPNDWNLPKFNNLLVHQPTIDAIRDGKSLAEIKQLWAAGIGDFTFRRSKYLVY